MRSAALARLREPDAVDEVLQNVALAVAQARQTGTEIQKTGVWLYRVLLRQCLLFRRRKGRQRKLQQQCLERQEAVGASSTNPLQWLLASEQRTLVRQALQTLPDREMEILLLKYVERWSCQQIADHLQVSATAVESRLHRARQRLRAKLERINV